MFFVVLNESRVSRAIWIEGELGAEALAETKEGGRGEKAAGTEEGFRSCRVSPPVPLPA